MKNIFLSIVSLLVIAGCGGGSGGRSTGQQHPPSSDGKQSTVDVKYTLNGSMRPTCHDADETGEKNPENSSSVQCIWYCGRYKGGHTMSVFLDFEKTENTDEGIWELSDESLYEASPHVCRDM